MLERQLAEQTRELVKLRDDRVRLMDMIKQLLSRPNVAPEPVSQVPNVQPSVAQQPGPTVSPTVSTLPNPQPVVQSDDEQTDDQPDDQTSEDEHDDSESLYEKMRMERLARNRSLQTPKVQIVQPDIPTPETDEHVEVDHIPIPSRDDIMSFMVEDPGWGG
jgi:hypothetical protein